MLKIIFLDVRFQLVFVSLIMGYVIPVTGLKRLSFIVKRVLIG